MNDIHHLLVALLQQTPDVARGLSLRQQPSIELQHDNWCTVRPPVELETNVAEDYAKFYNHEEGPYLGLLLVESAY